MHPTQKHIAAHLGVSKATVSLALRRHARIPAATREKVERAAAQLGYRPNAFLAAHMANLRSTRAPRYRATLAFISDLPGGAAAVRRHPRDRLYWHGALARARSLGYEITLFSLTEPGMTTARLDQILRNRGIHGAIVAPLNEAAGRLDLQWENLAAVSLGYSMRNPLLHRACHDNFNTITRLVEQLEARGYRRIGLAMDENDNTRVNKLWLAGYLAYQHGRNRRSAVPPHMAVDWNADTCVAWFKQHRPDVIVTVRVEVVGWLRQAGIAVPADVGYASVGWRKNAFHCSGYDQNFELIAAAAVDRVVEQLHRNERGVPANPNITLVAGQWIEGSTLKPLREGAAIYCAEPSR